MKLSEEEFMTGLSQGRFELEGSIVVKLPDIIYKKGSGELNAEKCMMIVLKARHHRKQNPPPPLEVHEPDFEGVGGTD